MTMIANSNSGDYALSQAALCSGLANIADGKYFYLSLVSISIATRSKKRIKYQCG
jgi:hypothetical protein